MPRHLLLVLILTLGVTRSSAYGQDPPEILRLATQTSERVAKEHPKRVLLSMGSKCLLDAQLCENLEASLHEALTKLIPDVQFVSRSDVVNEIKRKGLLEIDAYEEWVVRDLAPEMGVDIIVDEKLVWQGHGYELTAGVFRVTGDKKIRTFTAKVNTPDLASKTDPIFVKDQDSGVSLVVFSGGANPSGKPYVPSCLRCPDPDYPEAARQKEVEGIIVFLATISVNGTAEQLAVIKSFDPTLTANAIQAVHSWKFKPATGPDGKPFATRVPIEVTFRLLH